jgi:hypothetical protein
LDIPWEKLEDLVDIFLETSTKNFVCFIETETGKSVGFQETFAHHIQYSSWSSNYNMWLVLESLFLSSKISSAGRTVHNDLEMFSECLSDSLDLLGEFSGGR